MSETPQDALDFVEQTQQSDITEREANRKNRENPLGEEHLRDQLQAEYDQKLKQLQVKHAEELEKFRGLYAGTVNTQPVPETNVESNGSVPESPLSQVDATLKQFQIGLPGGVVARNRRVLVIRKLYTLDPIRYSWVNLWKSDLLVGYKETDREKLLTDALGESPIKLTREQKQLLRMERGISRGE